MHDGNRVGRRVVVRSRRKWKLNIQHNAGRRWSNSKLRLVKKRGRYVLRSEDWRDNDYNDLVLDVRRLRSKGRRPVRKKRRKPRRNRGVVLPKGRWQVQVIQKRAAFHQRFIVSGAKKGRGRHNGNKVGKRVNVVSRRAWRLRVDHNSGRKWAPSKHRLKRVGQNFVLRTEDWVDNDFNDLVLRIRRLKQRRSSGRGRPRPTPPRPPKGEKIAAGETAKFWGDPHFKGGDGGLFDVQGAPGKTYNLLTDKGLTYHGRFDGWGRGVTVVGRTHIRLLGARGKSDIVFEPKRNLAILNGKKIGSRPTPTADGGLVKTQGRDLITQTREGYRIVQHGMGRGSRSYINAEVHTGKKGVAMDGVKPGGLLGITFDKDKKRRDGKKGRGAQGEGAIDGHVTDYEVGRFKPDHPIIFDWKFYLRTYPDLGRAGLRNRAQALQHWIKYGMKEGRRAVPTFCPKHYLAMYGDIRKAAAKSGQNPLHFAIVHWLRYGISESRKGIMAPPPRPGRKPPKNKGVVMPRGKWQVRVTGKHAAFHQRIAVVGRVLSGGGTHEANQRGQGVDVKASVPWGLRVDHNDGKRWAPSLHRLTGRGDVYVLRTEDWVDGDFNDLVLSLKKLKEPVPQPRKGEKIASEETARFWGDPHFVGGDGGKFDVQGEPGKTYNLLTDKGLFYYGRFDGWGNGVTVVGRTHIRLLGGSGKSDIFFEPKANIALHNGKRVGTQATPTADGGLVKMQGTDLVTQTSEGYRIVQHNKGSGNRKYINSEVHTGKKGVAMDGVKPGGLLGITFDKDNKKRDGKKGRGAQGEGAIDGHYTDYEVNRYVPNHPLVFDWKYYLETYKDLRSAGLNNQDAALNHWKTHGIKEGRRAIASFCPREYLQMHSDVRRAATQSPMDDLQFAIVHFVTYGHMEGRRGILAPKPPVLDRPRTLSELRGRLGKAMPDTGTSGPLSGGPRRTGQDYLNVDAPDLTEALAALKKRR